MNEALEILAKMLENIFFHDGWYKFYRGKTKGRVAADLNWSEDKSRVEICLYDYDYWTRLVDAWNTICPGSIPSFDPGYIPLEERPPVPAKPAFCCLVAVTLTAETKVFEISSDLHEDHKKSFKNLFQCLGFTVKESNLMEGKKNAACNIAV